MTIEEGEVKVWTVCEGCNGEAADATKVTKPCGRCIMSPRPGHLATYVSLREFARALERATHPTSPN